jgi:heme exporter protein A
VQLTAEKLILCRGGRTVVDGLSFALKGGEALLLTGANGAGKTTLLRALAGFIVPTEGSVRFAGAGFEEVSEGREHLHFVGHLDGTKAHLSVAENLSFWARYLGHNPASGASLRAALDRFGLGGLEDIPAGYLSAGQRRRLALARLAVAERPLWLLDEPTVSLDASAIQMLIAATNEHVAGGGMAVVATHVALGLEQAREIRLGRAEAAA